MSECISVKSADLTYCQRHRDVILNRAKDYYENDEERLRGQARDKCRNLSEKKHKKREYGGNRYHNMSEEKKQRLKEYQKNYREANNNEENNFFNGNLIVLQIK